MVLYDYHSFYMVLLHVCVCDPCVCVNCRLMSEGSSSSSSSSSSNRPKRTVTQAELNPKQKFKKLRTAQITAGLSAEQLKERLEAEWNVEKDKQARTNKAKAKAATKAAKQTEKHQRELAQRRKENKKFNTQIDKFGLVALHERRRQPSDSPEAANEPLSPAAQRELIARDAARLIKEEEVRENLIKLAANQAEREKALGKLKE